MFSENWSYTRYHDIKYFYDYYDHLCDEVEIFTFFGFHLKKNYARAFLTV